MSQSFADLGVSRPVVAALAERGIHEPFAIQELVIGDVLAGRDVLAKSPTGSGKTLAFAVPMIERIEPGRGPAALVLAPTRELAAQIVEQSQPLARVNRLEVAAVYGGVGFEKQIRACKRADILVATPGRLAVDRIVGAGPQQGQTLFFSATLGREAGRIAGEYTHDPARHEHVPEPV